MYEGTGTITATEAQASALPGKLKPGRLLVLSVQHEGEGMDQETLARYHTLFMAKDVGKGTGLGRSVVQGVIEQSGGAMSIASQKGKEMTASLFLPVADEEETNHKQLADHPSPPQYETASRRKYTVLAVDDDALVLMNTTVMLEDLGHTVIEAYSGAAALKELRESGKHIDLVITDHSMPRMSGSELAALVQQDWPELPVVLATGYAELPAGGDNRLPRLPKPFSQSQLEDILASVLGR